MKFGICDDEVEQTKVVRAILEDNKLVQDDDTIQIFTPDEINNDVEEKNFDCDILITDIYYAGSKFTGIDMAKKINKVYPLCKIVFISSYGDFAEDTYEADHVYFVQKKNVDTILPRAVKKAIRVHQEEAVEKVFSFFSEGLQTYVRVRDILYIERDERNIRIVTKDKPYPCIYSLAKVMKKLQNENLVRANGSIIVNVAHIKSITTEEITMTDGKMTEISPIYARKVKDAYMQWWKERL